MNKKYFIFIIVIIITIIMAGYFLFFRKEKPIAEIKVENYFKYNEIIKRKIGTSGGILENKEKSIIITFPPLNQETEITLSFKKSNFEVKAGVGSPITINISPNINLPSSSVPIIIKVKYDGRYDLPIPYLIDEKNKLHLVNLGEIDAKNNYFTILTFHGGNYSWIYAN